MYLALAQAYYSMFGLTGDKIVRQFTLFANQYRGEPEKRANELVAEADNFRLQTGIQTSIIGFYNQSATRVWEIEINVKNWFLERLKQFGIQYILGSNGDIHLMKVDPIPMIDESEMEVGYIILENGGTIQANVIRWGTWSNYSHAAIYAGDGDILEALGGGMERSRLSVAVEHCDLIAVMRPVNYTFGAGANAVIYAMKSAGELGGVKKPYDYTGAVASGVSWTTAIIVYPLLPIKVAEAAKNALSGSDKQFFCSEVVCEAYRQAQMPIVSTSPQNTIPGALYHSPNLVKVGYLKYKV